MTCKDIDGNEIKAGDTVDCVTASQFDAVTGVHGRVGRRYKVTRVDDTGNIMLEGLSGSIPRRFRKVPTASRPVYPFKAGDVVVCKDARGNGYLDLTEGRSYTVLETHDWASTDTVVVEDDGGCRYEFHAVRFCARDEYTPPTAGGVVEALAAANARAEKAVRDFDYAAREAARLAQRVRDLEVQLAGETQAKDRLAAAYSDMVAQRNVHLEKSENLRATFRAVVKACE